MAWTRHGHYSFEEDQPGAIFTQVGKLRMLFGFGVGKSPSISIWQHRRH